MAVAPVGPHLVVLRALGLGDLLTAVPALRALARAFPEHHRLLLAPAGLAPLVALVDVPETGARAIHAVVPQRGLRRPLPGETFAADVAVNLHGRGPQSHRALLEAEPRRLVAFRCAEAGLDDGPEHRDDEHEVARWCRMLAAHGIAADPAELSLAPPAMAVPPGRVGATVIHPGAASGARRWPAGRFAAVARAERDAGRRVVDTGSLAERARCCAVAEGAGLGEDAVLAGALGLAELAAHVGAAGRVVCGDTGVAHLATALGTPSVVLFGPTSPLAWGPPRDLRHEVLWAGTTGDPHADVCDEGLLRIGVGDVLDALDRLPERDARLGLAA